MKKLKNKFFDAVGIEYDFAYFLEKEIGARGGLHDADVFRNGNVRDFGKLIETFADYFRQRLNRITFMPNEAEPGKAKARLEVSIDTLKEVAAIMKLSRKREPEDYHWLIIGALVGSISALLEHVEGKETH